MDYVTSRRSMLQQNGFALSKTHGKSMRPLIWGGEHYVAVAPLEDEPAIGDLLMFKYSPDGRNIVHRLVEIRDVGNDRIYIARGDNCLGCEQIRRDDIIGRVAEVHRISGFRPWHVIPKRQFSVTDPTYLRYSRFWSATWPLRRLYYLFRAHLHGLSARLRMILKM